MKVRSKAGSVSAGSGKSTHNYAVTIRRRIKEASSSREFYPIAIILAVPTLLMIPVVFFGFPLGDDAAIHFQWVSQFRSALREGCLYPRWLPEMNGGQGNPAGLYYPPFSLYIAAIFSLVTGSVTAGLSISVWLAFAVSGVTMYFLCRRLASPYASLAGAALYILAPYHLFDFYQRCALAEVWVFAWIPLLVYSIHRVAEGDDWRWMLLVATSFALIVLTHAPLMLAVVICLPLLILLMTRKAVRVLTVLSGLALGAGAAAVYLVPVLLERKFMRLDWLLDLRYYEYFLFERLGDSLFRYVFPPTAQDRHTVFLLDSNVIACATVLLLLTGILLLLLDWRSEGSPARSSLVAGVTGTTLFAVLMSTRLSIPLWEAVPELPFMQFPVRWFVIVSGGTCVLTAVALSTIGHRERAWLPASVAVSFSILSMFAVSFFSIARAPYLPVPINQVKPTADTPEHCPSWARMVPPDELRKSPAIVESGDAGIKPLAAGGAEQSYEVNATTGSTLIFRTIYFPGWTCRLDGNPVELTKSDTGNMEIQVPEGRHEIRLSFEDTWPRTAGKAISAVSLLILFGLSPVVRIPAKRFRRKDADRQNEAPEAAAEAISVRS